MLPLTSPQDTEGHFSRLHSISGFEPYRRIDRRLIPRQPKRDAPLAQTCVFYRPTHVADHPIPSSDHDSGRTDQPVHNQDAIVEYTSLVTTPDKVPFYHPAVRRLRFVYQASHDQDSFLATSTGTISISITLFGTESSEVRASLLKPNSKLRRICLALLQTLWKNGRGTRDGYRSRTPHDVSSFFFVQPKHV